MTTPPLNADPMRLDAEFRVQLERLFADLEAGGIPFRLVEGFRTQERQAWLYASGRTRPGAILTQKDGAPGVWPDDHTPVSERGHSRQSYHQTGLAADCYPVGDGKVWIPPASHEVWFLYATKAHALGLRAGREWGDSPHVEMRRAIAVEAA